MIFLEFWIQFHIRVTKTNMNMRIPISASFAPLATSSLRRGMEPFQFLHSVFD